MLRDFGEVMESELCNGGVRLAIKMSASIQSLGLLSHNGNCKHAANLALMKGQRCVRLQSQQKTEAFSILPVTFELMFTAVLVPWK